MNDEKLLLGELKEFKRTTTKELHDIKALVLSLDRFRWRVIGFAAGTSFLASAVVTTIIEIMRH